ncbi:MalY/PatB family protein [Ornithinicoccus halotolerans]|uniref:MalY/PatB family protein n=1 Tax=Ornithinicoccus halotolerans TaxID=1748220 RepID=UPI0012960F9A|nr:aminotransferase class I/II-fold pyridoxal phosphate-dependent enzyme [Ornithinicoccus halotolerans]
MMLRDLDDDALRSAAPLKWALDGPDVLPAWVAEMDFPVAEPVQHAVTAAAATGVLGYPPPAETLGLPDAFAGFARRHWDWPVDTGRVTVLGSVMAGMALALRQLAEAGPVVVPTPVYPPFLATVTDTGHALRAVPLLERAGRYRLDLAAIARELADGARTVLLCHPHNPVGRAWSAEELAELRDVVEPAGARVITDEIHAPLTHPGTAFVPYAQVASSDAPVTTLTAATKAFNMPGLPCALLVSQLREDHARLQRLPPVLTHGATGLGMAAATAAYRDGDRWLAAVRERVAGNLALLQERLADRLPAVRMAPAEATYLAWLDVRELGLAAPARTALERGRVRLEQQDFGPGSAGHVRVNVGTSPVRVEQIAERLVRAWG